MKVRAHKIYLQLRISLISGLDSYFKTSLGNLNFHCFRKEESQAISDFTEHADEMTERFSVTVKLQEDKMNQLTELLNRLEGWVRYLVLLEIKSQLLIYF